jgi:hypothetical protein
MTTLTSNPSPSLTATHWSVYNGKVPGPDCDPHRVNTESFENMLSRSQQGKIPVLPLTCEMKYGGLLMVCGLCVDRQSLSS